MSECEVVAELNRKLVEENSVKEMDQDAFMSKHLAYEHKYEAESKLIDQLKKTRTDRLQKAEALSAFMFEIQEQDSLIQKFDEKLWIATIDTVDVCTDGKLIFKFKNKTEVTV